MVFEPSLGTNIIVGGNDSGKSTLLEAIAITLTGRIGRSRASDELNPYWFNKELVAEFFKAKRMGLTAEFPEFRIDLHLESEEKGLQRMRGIHNLSNEDSIGLSIHARPDPEYLAELESYFSTDDYPDILPVEYYTLEWRDFSDAPVFRTPKGIGTSIIDSQAVAAKVGLDLYTRQLLDSKIDERVKTEISVEHRRLRSELGKKELAKINEQLHAEATNNGSQAVGVQVDQSRSASWDSTLIPGIEDLPLNLAGQGAQVTAKTLLALSAIGESQSCILIEEPENHLSHTRLRLLLNLIEQEAGDKQLFITTHSSFVMNRLGLDKLAMVSEGAVHKFEVLTDPTVRFFRKVSGFDTLRLLLADQVVAVEGPSDEIIFNRFFRDLHAKDPLDAGIDVISVKGVGFSRVLELSAQLERKVACLRDNDGKVKAYWETRDNLKSFLKDGERELFIGDPELGCTLEPQIGSVNATDKLRELLCLKDSQDPVDWMSKDHNKTEAAIRIADSESSLIPPTYFVEAIAFVVQDGI
ncbi:AAA family ATPase [Corynebacterium sp. H127]|uniref:AAA family ATPase n=1 Tax=Corynebacterium sp. H127 TaxID=3133418 RepID=UPI00309D89FB